MGQENSSQTAPSQLLTIVVTILVTTLVVGGGVYYFTNKSQPKPLSINYVVNDDQIENYEASYDKFAGWITYTNPIHNFSFKYPADQGFEIQENGGMDFEPGHFGSSLAEPSSEISFNVDVFYTPDWTSLGNIYGDVDALKKGFEAGGIEEVAKLSREVNLQKAANFPNPQVGEITAFNFDGGTGYGFTVTDRLNWCFNVDVACGSGRVVENPLTVVYVTNGSDIYRIEFPLDSLNKDIFTTFKFGN